MKEVYATKKEAASRKIVLSDMETDHVRGKALETFRRPAYSVTNHSCEGKCVLCGRKKG